MTRPATAAIRCYERAGFVRQTPYRLIALSEYRQSTAEGGSRPLCPKNAAE